MRGAVTLALALLCMACIEGGYPSADHPISDPFSMTQGQRLAAMNQIGGATSASLQWSYALLPGCTLRIDVDGDRGPMPSVDIPLMGAAIGISSDQTHKTFGVRVTPHSSTSGPWLPVLHGRDWADVSGMQLLLRVLQKGCDDALASSRPAAASPRAPYNTTIQE